MVVPIQRVPTVHDAGLPLGQIGLQFHERQRARTPLRFAGHRVEVHVLEGEDHVQFATRRIRVVLGLFHRHAGHLADGDETLAGQHLTVHLLQELVHAGPVRHREVHVPIGERLGLRQQVDDIHPEAVDASLDPAVHHVVHRAPDIGVLPVEVGLTAGELVQEVLTGGGIEFPRRAREVRPPVGGFGTRRTGLEPVTGRAPPVPIALRIVTAGATLEEPRMLVAGVVHHQIHHQPHATRMHR
ncbi:unannotated protein [freshwater metagenome]|uniref:Unannotated protein n=1 Tax=freshwater metagenome TaxID=449393 RepID=A0A6J6GJT6_9ZZZZ